MIGRLWRHFREHAVLARELVTQARVLHIPGVGPRLFDETRDTGAFKLRVQIPQLRMDLRNFAGLVRAIVSLMLYAWLALYLFTISLLAGILLVR